jgi:hypothetical protein
MDAALLASRAVNLWTAAEQAHPESSPSISPINRPPVTGRPPNQPSSTAGHTDTYAQPPLPDSAQIVQFYADLERAIESRQLGEVTRLLPNLTEGEVRDWRDLFDDKDVQRIVASFQVRYVTRGEGVNAYARVAEDVRAVKTNGKTESVRKSVEFTLLTLGPQGWRQIRSEKMRP